MLCARFLGKISQFSFSRLNSVFVFVFSPFSLVLFFLVYFKLHINKLTTRTVILVRIYLIDTCAVFILYLCLFFLLLFATKCYLSFCLIFFSFFRVQPQKILVKCVCVRVSISLSWLFCTRSFFFFLLSSLDNSNKYHTFNILSFVYTEYGF
jgi:hypothetical protein